MNGKTFVVLCGVTVIAVVGAGIAVYAQQQTQTIPAPPQTAILPALAAHADSVARIQLKTPSYALDMHKSGTGWVDASRNNYPLRTASVVSLLTSLASMRPLAAKTADPTLYARIGVDDFKTGGDSTLVDLSDANGQSLGDLIVGNRSSALSFDPLGGTFVRAVGDKQSWLAQGAAAVPTDFSGWFDQIPNFADTAIDRVTILEGGKTVFDAKKNGTTYQLVAAANAAPPAAATTTAAASAAAAVAAPATAASPSAAAATGAPVAPAATAAPAAATPSAAAAPSASSAPAAAATAAAATPAASATPAAAPAPQANESNVEQVTEAIASGTFDDVTPATKIDFSKGRVIRFQTNTGVTLDVQLGTLAGKEEWVTLTPRASQGATAGQVKQAATLAAQTKGWAYQLPDYQLSGLKMSVADLTAPTPTDSSAQGSTPQNSQ